MNARDFLFRIVSLVAPTEQPSVSELRAYAIEQVRQEQNTGEFERFSRPASSRAVAAAVGRDPYPYNALEMFKSQYRSLQQPTSTSHTDAIPLPHTLPHPEEDPDDTVVMKAILKQRTTEEILSDSSLWR